MEGSGTLHQRSQGVYTLRVEFPAVNVERQWETETFHGTKKYATKRLAEMVRTVDERYSKRVTPTNLTFDTLFAQWTNGLSLKTSNPRAEITTYQETQRYERHIKHEFGKRVLTSLDRKEVRDFYARLRQPLMVRGEAVERPALSATSVLRIHQLLVAMCKWAVNEELIASSPMQDIKAPRASLPNPNPPEYRDLNTLLQRLWEEDQNLWLAVRLAATTALRRSELVAFRWSDVIIDGRDLKAVYVDKGLTMVPHRGAVVTKTKTGEEAAAKISIDDELVKVLRAMWKVFMAHNVNRGVTDGYIFATDETGEKPIYPDTLSTRLRKQENKYGAKSDRRRITFKSLRAFVASELQAMGTDITTAQAVLRHKSPLTTQRHYAAARERQLRESTIRVGQQFAKRGSELKRES